jgi:putative phage-type endonuclease
MNNENIDEMYKFIELLENSIFSKLKIDHLNEFNESNDLNEYTEDILTMDEIFDEDFLLDMEEEIYHQIDEYEIKNIFHIDNIIKYKITESITENILNSIYLICEDNNQNHNYDDSIIDLINENEIYNFVNERVNIYFEYVFPNIYSFSQIPRSIKIDEYDNNLPIIRINSDIINVLQKKIEELKTQYQPEQRTSEWYEFRNGLMTASNMYKILGTPSQYNSFICEKCLPVNSLQLQPDYYNTDNPRNWGQKYEKLTLQIYEMMFKTQVSEFGCIIHPKYNYIGASPDGIVTGDTLHPHYGRMIEIKNIVNREITGVPLEAYWVQMQIQMEVCDLNICNFIETRFKECDTIDEWKLIDASIKQKGVVITNILPNNIKPEYTFIIYNIDNNEEDFIYKWDLKHTQVKWWYMVEFSCVVVPRNKGWFNSVLPKLTEAWNTIIREKESGEYKIRLPKKKQTKSKCLIPTDLMETSTDLIETSVELQSEKNANESIKSLYISCNKNELNKNTIVIKDTLH